MSLIEKLKAGKRHIIITKWPGTELSVGLQVLSETELQEAAFEAERRFKVAGIEPSGTTAIEYAKEKITQILFRALVDPDKEAPNGTYSRAFSKVDDLRACFFSQDVKDELVDELNRLQEELSPRAEELSDKELSALYHEVKKKPEALKSLSSSSLRQLAAYSIFLSGRSATGNGSISSS